MRGGRAPLLRPKAPSWIDTGVAGARENWSRIHYELEVNERGDLQGEMSGQFSGELAADMRAEAAELGGDGDPTPMIREALQGDLRGPFIEGASLSAQQDFEQPLGLSGRVSVRSVRAQFDRLTVRQQELIGPVMTASYRRLRKYPRMMAGPARWDTSFGLTVPAGYGVLISKPVQDESDFMSYVWGCKFEAQRLECTRRLTLKRQIIHAGEWAEFIRQLERVRDNDTRQFEIRRLTDADLQAIR